LFDKIIEITGTGAGSNPPKAVAWMVEQGLLNPNEVGEQGNSPLEKVFAAYLTKDYMRDEDLADLDAISQELKDNGAKFSPEKATGVLEKFIDKHFIQSNPREWNQKVINFFKTQGVTLPPDSASALLKKLLEKQLTNNEDPIEMLEIVKFLETQGATISSQPAFNLLGVVSVNLRFFRRILFYLTNPSC